ncbi:MAG: glucose 1-dehydrogenase [Chloroflexota bacterium]
MTELLKGKTGLVTGGGAGIGRAAAQALAGEGARIIVADIEAEGGEETVKLVRENGGEAEFIRADVTKADEVAALVKETVQRYGSLDCAFNNAGIFGNPAPITETSEEEWYRVIDINLKGVWLCLKYEIEYMLAHGGGSIVNTASTAGLVAYPRNLTYIISKHGVLGLTKGVAMAYAAAGIRINAVCPASTRTPMLNTIAGGNPAAIEGMVARIPMGRLVEPEEVAAAVVWLCSPAASAVTGHALYVDGGYLTGNFLAMK